MYYLKLLVELPRNHLEQTVTFITASYAGAMANIIDIAPNYGHSGAVLAFCQTIHMSASFLSPMTAGFLVTQEDSIDEWRIFFIVSGMISVMTYIFYQIFGTAKIQYWNVIPPKNVKTAEENMFNNENKDLISKSKLEY
ncbi:sodium-dependent phosphate transport protein 3 isoform X7 [Drosophila busckii]|uniref:sodium-dependent phosphate transport protein 3 isoform X7 n=1 Tax=Drosophila busckii TaxID=30019 RepID=UPI00083F4DA6|nr:sodium-dependent phosphate transport protein 3 isoform X7 [Drosophila busckii]